MKSSSRCSFGALVLFLLQLVAAHPATVSSCDEAGLGAALSGGGTVLFDCSGTIRLTNTIRITVDTVLDANGHEVILTRDSSPIRLFEIQPGVALTLNGLILADGRVEGADNSRLGGVTGGLAQGGAILNDGGVLNANACQFRANSAAGGQGGWGAQGTSSPPNPPAGPGGKASGGAIFNRGGQVFLTNVVFLGNRAQGGTGGGNNGFLFYGASGGDSLGGAICSLGGALTLADCQFTTNAAVPGAAGQGFSSRGPSGSPFGGAIYSSNSIVTLLGTRLEGNSAEPGLHSNSGAGGGFYQLSGNSTVMNCVFLSNRANGGDSGLGNFEFNAGHSTGGGIHIASGMAEVRSCALIGNVAAGGRQQRAVGASGHGRGGGIYNAGTLTLVNCTLAGNLAQAGQALAASGGGFGGALYHNSGAVSVTHCTIVDNHVKNSPNVGQNDNPSAGAAFYSLPAGALVQNSILAYNIGEFAYGLSGDNCYGNFSDGGNNVSSDRSCFSSTNSLSNTDPNLGPLADYGGITPTMALLSGSPAIDAALNTACPPTDQRGSARPQGAGCDIGAFEGSVSFPLFRFTSATYFGSESNGGVGVTVTRTDGSGTASCRLSTRDGTARVGSDYVGTNVVLSFADGEISREFTIAILSDETSDTMETFEAMLSPIVGSAPIGQPATATVLIDYESRGQLQFSAANYFVQESNSTLLVPVLRSGGSYSRVSVQFGSAYVIAKNAAVPGWDYVGTGGVLTFEPGQTSNSFSIHILDDAGFEPEEFFPMSLVNPLGGATLGSNANALVHILDDDPLPRITEIRPESERRFRLSWVSSLGHLYQVQYKDRIEDASWIEIPGVTQSFSPMASIIVIAPPESQQRFYRIALVSNP